MIYGINYNISYPESIWWSKEKVQQVREQYKSITGDLPGFSLVHDFIWITVNKTVVEEKFVND